MPHALILMVTKYCDIFTVKVKRKNVGLVNNDGWTKVDCTVRKVIMLV